MITNRRRFAVSLKAIGLVAGCAALAACASMNQGVKGAGQDFTALIAEDGGPEMAPAALPRYRSGQSFSFSDGRVHRVVAADGKQVSWQGPQGESFTTDRSFVVPKLSSSLAGSKHSIINGAEGLWPLAVGKSDRMRIARSSVDAAGGQISKAARSYNCRVSNTERLSVPAGSFDTYRVQCTRFSSSGKRLVETRVWHYAPEVGHFVRYEEIDRKTGVRNAIDLVGFAG